MADTYDLWKIPSLASELKSKLQNHMKALHDMVVKLVQKLAEPLVKRIQELSVPPTSRPSNLAIVKSMVEALMAVQPKFEQLPNKKYANVDDKSTNPILSNATIGNKLVEAATTAPATEELYGGISKARIYMESQAGQRVLVNRLAVVEGNIKDSLIALACREFEKDRDINRKKMIEPMQRMFAHGGGPLTADLQTRLRSTLENMNLQFINRTVNPTLLPDLFNMEDKHEDIKASLLALLRNKIADNDISSIFVGTMAALNRAIQNS